MRYDLKAFSLVISKPNYPRKLCNGCGVHMSNFDYGRERSCQECTQVSVDRHNRKGVVGGIRRLPAAVRYIADNDNQPVASKQCLSCECVLPISDFVENKRGRAGVSADCSYCLSVIRSARDRSSEYTKRSIARGLLQRDGSVGPARLKAMRINKIARFRKRQVAERKAIGRRIDTYLNHFYKPWNKPGLSSADKYRIRYDLDIEFRLMGRTKTRMRRRGIKGDALKKMRAVLSGRAGEGSKRSIETLMGYTMDDLRTHLERQFTDGMSWEVFKTGDIHIDHIRPLNTFDLQDQADAEQAWALSNLRPLWGYDNVRRPKDGSDVKWIASNDNVKHAVALAA